MLFMTMKEICTRSVSLLLLHVAQLLLPVLQRRMVCKDLLELLTKFKKCLQSLVTMYWICLKLLLLEVNRVERVAC